MQHFRWSQCWAHFLPIMSLSLLLRIQLTDGDFGDQVIIQVKLLMTQL